MTRTSGHRAVLLLAVTGVLLGTTLGAQAQPTRPIPTAPVTSSDPSISPVSPPASPASPASSSSAGASVLETHGAQGPVAPLDAGGQDAGGVEDGDGKSPDLTNSHFWQDGTNRLFFATATDLGYLYFRPRGIVGYGRPFWTWIGIEANPQVSQRNLGAYAGLHGALPLIDLRIGSRYVFAFQQAYLAPRDHYGRLEFQSVDLARSKYVDLEAELDGKIPAGPGSVLLVGTVARFSGVPKGDYLFDETLRVIVKLPYVWRARGGYGLRFGSAGRLGVGLVAEVLHVPERHTSVVRAGLIATAALSNHLEVIGSFIPPIHSPDTLGVAGGDFAQLGVRFRWATGSPYESLIVPVVF